ncbi:FAD/NAD(P)-binding domain-containing protein [Periconia macrospinosa]|uniref:FAD/NAD(P)-binding domain-containing protein n=1 Tax=Periconia macrospinosa TaxID=97972 RepID=A0A2V1DGF5_9PLEO|nr:FAD/NAD(P)-binding domain-containing protein [Periconia macrospinosa]
MAGTAPKIVVVGGGPVGITVAHALTRAGIDFVLLESRPSIVMAAGASLVMSQIGLRALSQFGVLPAIEKVSSPLSMCKRFDHEGRTIGDAKLFTYLHENHGCASRIITRRSLMQVLFDALPAEAQSKLLPNKKMLSLEKTEDGVVVKCTDGSSYEGTLVIGADGAYSAVRKHMATMNGQQDTPAEQQQQDDKELPYLTTYRCFWMRFPRLPGITPGDMTESHGPQATTQATRRPPRRYSDDDQAAFVAKWGHLPLNENPNHQNRDGLNVLTLGEAYTHNIQTGFINLEEGVVADWSRGGRAVLVGDAAHKFTPSTGAGCNNGIVDVVVLVNKLHKIFSKASTSANIAEDELAAAFREYQDARFDVVTLECSFSSRATNNASWGTSFAKFMDLYVLSTDFILRLFLSWAARETALTPVFDFIEGEDKIVGKYPWLHKIPVPQAQKIV